ncbi:unnamed protein product [Cladocopium goreaui]|uniref:Uncharacterized protein n=1 Tax=Cladocopium goreaui TaxID=2562237 RepID=A0A9P1DMG6_9DINO|nr:unnamed protein product [Cladocopium goreaui]
MVASYDGKEGGPEFSGPKHGAEDATVCVTGFDSFSNLFMFVEDGAENSHSEISWIDDQSAEQKAMKVCVCPEKFALLAHLCQYATVA